MMESRINLKVAGAVLLLRLSWNEDFDDEDEICENGGNGEICRRQRESSFFIFRMIYIE